MKNEMSWKQIIGFVVGSVAAVSLLAWQEADAAITWSPTSPQTGTNWLATNTTHPTTGDSNYYLKLFYPDNSLACDPTFGTLNDTDGFEIGAAGPFGGSNWSGYGCSGINFNQDGTWTLDIYSDSGKTTQINTGTFCTGSACGGGGGGGGSSVSSSSPAQEIFASSTMQEYSIASYEIVDNPTQDLFEGFIMFMIAFIGMVWLLRKH